MGDDGVFLLDSLLDTLQLDSIAAVVGASLRVVQYRGWDRIQNDVIDMAWG